MVYVPTYREGSENNRQIDVARFEEALPEYTLINQLHPSISKSIYSHYTRIDDYGGCDY